MKPGTIVKLRDGAVGTVVYHGLDGYGIRWGRIVLSPADRALIALGGLFGEPSELLADKQGALEELMPEAMLRRPYPSATLPCVGEKYSIQSPI